MTQRKKSKLLSFLFLAALCPRLRVYAQSYSITEKQLTILEQNNEELRTELITLSEQAQELRTLSEKMKKSCQRLEMQNKIIKTVAIVGIVAAAGGGFYLGYKVGGAQ